MTTAVQQDMIAHADKEIAPIKGNLADTLERIDATQSKLAALSLAREKRAQQLHEARSAHQLREQEHSQATAYAALAVDTLQEQPAIQAASKTKKLLQSAMKELEQLEREAKEAEHVAQVREQELESLHTQLVSDRERLQADLRKVQSARQQAYGELVQAKHAAILAGYQERQARIDERRTQLVAASMELNDFYEAALAEFHDWPIELRRDIVHLATPTDATSRAIEAALLYVKTMLSERPQVIEDLPTDMKRRGMTLWPVITVHPDEVITAARYPQGLRLHQEQLERLLSEYRAYLASQE